MIVSYEIYKHTNKVDKHLLMFNFCKQAIIPNSVGIVADNVLKPIWRGSIGHMYNH